MVELRSDAQSKKLWTLAAESGMDEAGFRAWLADTLGRTVDSTKTLTKTEAHELIELLEADLRTPIAEANDAVFESELVDPA